MEKLKQIKDPKCVAPYDEIWENDIYEVQVNHTEINRKAALHLCIRRHDLSIEAHNWADMQAIKNQLTGPECEGVELFPAESRMLNCENMYHMWVVCDESHFDLGYEQGRNVNE